MYTSIFVEIEQLGMKIYRGCFCSYIWIWQSTYYIVRFRCRGGMWGTDKGLEMKKKKNIKM